MAGIDRSFERAIKAWRAALGHSQSRAAIVLGCPLKTLQNWEISRTRPASILQRLLLDRFAADLGEPPKPSRSRQTPTTPRAPARPPSRAS
jgi:transcriptional regulator with XRE-family HTH domain